MAIHTEDTISHIMMVAIVTALVALAALLAIVMVVGGTLGMDMVGTAVGGPMVGVGVVLVGVADMVAGVTLARGGVVNTAVDIKLIKTTNNTTLE